MLVLQKYISTAIPDSTQDSKILLMDLGAYKLQTQVVDLISSNPNYLELRFLKYISLQGNLGLCQWVMTQ